MTSRYGFCRIGRMDIYVWVGLCGIGSCHGVWFLVWMARNLCFLLRHGMFWTWLSTSSLSNIYAITIKKTIFVSASYYGWFVCKCHATIIKLVFLTIWTENCMEITPVLYRLLDRVKRVDLYLHRELYGMRKIPHLEYYWICQNFTDWWVWN